MNVYQPQLQLATGILTLADWDGQGTPPDNFVVARREDGSIASSYGDAIWYVTAYHTLKKPTQLNFSFWEAQSQPSTEELARAQELRWLMFLLMWCRPTPLHMRTLNGYLQHLRAAARFAVAHSLSLPQLLGSETLLQSARNVLHPADLKAVNVMIAFLNHLGPAVVRFDVAAGNTLRKMKTDVLAYQAALKQHPPIPTRIYSHLLTTIQSTLVAFSSVAEQAIDYAILCAKKKQEEGDEFAPPVLPAELAAYLLRSGFLVRPRGVISALKASQYAAKLLIQAFSGMRDQEASTLPFDCLREEQIDGLKHYVLQGVTTKLNRGKARVTKWVTSREGATAVGLARQIAIGMSRFLGISGTQSLPLFASTAYLATESLALKFNGGAPRIANLDLSGMLREIMWPILCPTIEDADLCELEQIDPHRAWRSEPKFTVGNRWPLTSHQLRRSLALYAQRSGLVSLPSLKRQLQHITEEMSRYYARGSAFAVDFLAGQKNHFGRDWQEAQPVSSALSYMLHVLYSDEVLFGGHVQWVDRNLRDAGGMILIDREATLRRFKKGELAYRETILGGCTSTEGCKSVAINTLDIDCVTGCKNLVGRLSSLERVIAVQERFVASLEPGSVEHTTEFKDLQVLREAREQFIIERKEAA